MDTILHWAASMSGKSFPALLCHNYIPLAHANTTLILHHGASLSASSSTGVCSHTCTCTRSNTALCFNLSSASRRYAVSCLRLLGLCLLQEALAHGHKHIAHDEAQKRVLECSLASRRYAVSCLGLLCLCLLQEALARYRAAVARQYGATSFQSLGTLETHNEAQPSSHPMFSG